MSVFATLLITVLCYWSGLEGGFLFDDTPNLKDLGAYGGVTDWESFKSFVFGGWSGPTGRPLSLLSFLIDDNNWPSQAARFKPTNLAIHLICGLLLLWATLLTLRFYGAEESTAQWLAVFSASCWLLHPYLASTTLYVVQRMAQLAALFVFAGITGYLHGRLMLATRPRAAYGWMGCSLVVGTLLAVLSKENGILLPMLVGMIEYCAPDHARKITLNRWFIAVFLGLPTLAVLGYLASAIDFSVNPWPTRGFNQVERLLSEPRILWDYLGNLYLPRIEGQGLYRDDFVISRSLTNPLSTLPALLGLMGLMMLAITQRHRWRLFSLAVLFFFVGHLTESTVIGLELYFEHRNYLPAAFLFLPLGSGLHALGGYVRKPIPALASVLIVVLLALFTWQRAQLWSDTNNLELFWATTATNSPRAQNALAGFYMRQGLVNDARQTLEAAVVRLPDSPLLTVQLLLQKIWMQQASDEDFAKAAELLAKQPFDAQAVAALRSLVDRVTEPDQPKSYLLATRKLIKRLNVQATYNQFPLFVRLVPYLNAQLQLANRNVAGAVEEYALAMERYNDTDSALEMVAEVASQGYPLEALRLLDKAEALYREQSDRSLKRSRTVYDHEIMRLRNTLNDEIKTR